MSLSPLTKITFFSKVIITTRTSRDWLYKHPRQACGHMLVFSALTEGWGRRIAMILKPPLAMQWVLGWAGLLWETPPIWIRSSLGKCLRFPALQISLCFPRGFQKAFQRQASLMASLPVRVNTYGLQFQHCDVQVINFKPTAHTPIHCNLNKICS